ncbi:histidine phosphatase family protein [bacterium]|nr:histidine phosphatase family protein [bacterium]
MFRRKCKVTFICHGSTINSEENRFYDDESHPPLNENGKIEMEKISKWLRAKGLKTDVLYSCSALRCVQSSRIISQYLNADYKVIDSLRSRKAGLWSGLTFEQIEVKYPSELDKYHSDRKNFWVEGGENTDELNKRVSAALSKLVEENVGKRIIIVTHPEVIQSAVATALSIPVENQFKIYIPQGSATQISYYQGWSSLVYSAYLPL